MSYTTDEKLEIIRLVENSHLGVKRTLNHLGVARATFYRWYERFQAHGVAGLNNHYRGPARSWNRLPEQIRSKLIEVALELPELSPRELAVRFTHVHEYYVSESTVYRLLKSHDLITSPAFVVIKAANEFKDKTTGVNQLWQTDFTYFKVMGWGWFYLSTVLDDYSRYIIAWRLCTTMQASDVTQTLEAALGISECQSAGVEHKPRLLSDNGPCYISKELALWLKGQGMGHVRGAPNHPQTQGKIERWHQTLKSCVLLEHYYLPGALEQSVGGFVDYYNHDRYHESLSNLTPADVYFGRGESILEERRKIKEQTIQSRRIQHQLETV